MLCSSQKLKEKYFKSAILCGTEKVSNTGDGKTRDTLVLRVFREIVVVRNCSILIQYHLENGLMGRK